jgi:hypothetical protein
MEKMLMSKEPLVIDTNSLVRFAESANPPLNIILAHSRKNSNILPYCSLLYTLYIARISEFFSNYSVLSVEFWVSP